MQHPDLAHSTASADAIRVPIENHHRRRFGHFLVMSVLPFAILLPTAPGFAQSDPTTKPFDGLFFGLDIGTQNYFSGAVVGDVDVLSRDFKTVTDLSMGYRWQLADDRLLVGLKIHFGLTNGELRHVHAGSGFEIQHDNDSQFGYGGEIGTVLGSRRAIALFLYGYETERDFDVTITTPFGSFRQSDEQGIFRFGLGAELRLRRGFHLRGTLGTDRADFGNRFTSQNVDGRTEVGIGFIYQL